MKKSLIALGVLGAFSGAAFAQSSVTVYGNIDAGVLYQSNLPTASGGKGSSITMDGFGAEVPSLWGIKGSEDLGNGLKAVFNVEGGFGAGNGTLDGGSGVLFDREANVGLKGGFGEVLLGRSFSPFTISLIESDTSGFDDFGSLLNAEIQSSAALYGAGNGGAGATLNSLLWPVNSILYNSPDFGGFHGSIQYGIGGVAGSTSTNSLWSAALFYAGGPFSATIGYLEQKGDPGVTIGATAAATAQTTLKAYNVGGTYTIGNLKVGLAWEEYQDPFDNETIAGQTGHPKQDYIDLTALYSVTSALKVKGAYIHLNDKTISSANANLFKLGLDYYLSKRTNLYAEVGHTSNGQNANMSVYFVPSGIAYGVNQTAAEFGIQHSF